MDRRIPATVLLLEAREDSRAVYVEALRTAGVDVTEVGDSQAALGAAKAIRPRVIIASFDSRTRDDRLTFAGQIEGVKGVTDRLTVQGRR